MQLRTSQLEGHLGKTLAPVYVVSGDEPLQVQETLDAIRAAARAKGFDERIRLEADRSFEWETLQGHADNLSLFAQRRLIDLRIPNAKPGDTGAKALRAYAKRPAADTVLLVSTSKLDASGRATRWYKSLAAVGVCVEIWPIEPAKLPAWIRQRAARAGIKLGADAAQLIAERVEGNLLACAQEIEKLSLLLASRAADTETGMETVMEAVSDSARFSVFDLVDSALACHAARTVRITQGLREEGVEPTLVAWALSREVRALARMAHGRAQGLEMERLLSDHRVWPKRKRAVAGTLQRLTLTDLHRLLRQAVRIEHVLKGAAAGEAWDELLRLALGLAGVKLLATSAYNRGQ